MAVCSICLGTGQVLRVDHEIYGEVDDVVSRIESCPLCGDVKIIVEPAADREPVFEATDAAA